MTENAIEAVRLLVVSKEPTVVRSLWSIGEANSWQLETVGSGWEALEFVQAGFTPDLLLLDLPRGDAQIAYTSCAGCADFVPNLPIILLCYPDDAGRKNEAIRLGAQDYLVRPVDDEQLESVIRGQLELAETTASRWTLRVRTSNRSATTHSLWARVRSCASFAHKQNCWRKPMSRC